jgi:hypothetical protein
MRTPRTTVSPDRRTRSGLRPVPDLPPVPSPRRPADEILGVRKGHIYAFPIWEIDPKTGLVILYEANPATGQLTDTENPRRVALVASAQQARTDAKPRIVWDYVGQTVREVEVREGEHVDDKPWADVIAGRPVTIAEGMWDKAERDRQEIAHIHKIKPRFNYDHNLENDERIEIWRQVELRHARDDAAHRARWIPLELRTELAELTAQRAVIGAGLDGNEPQYPLTVLWRFVSSWPPAVRAVATGLLLWAVAVGGTVTGLTTWGWPRVLALIFALALCSSVFAAVFGGRKSRRRKRWKNYFRS